jgi:hypothetical protein
VQLGQITSQRHSASGAQHFVIARPVSQLNSLDLPSSKPAGIRTARITKQLCYYFLTNARHIATSCLDYLSTTLLSAQRHRPGSPYRLSANMDVVEVSFPLSYPTPAPPAANLLCALRFASPRLAFPYAGAMSSSQTTRDWSCWSGSVALFVLSYWSGPAPLFCHCTLSDGCCPQSSRVRTPPRLPCLRPDEIPLLVSLPMGRFSSAHPLLPHLKTAPLPLHAAMQLPTVLNLSTWSVHTHPSPDSSTMAKFRRWNGALERAKSHSQNPSWSSALAATFHT